MQKPTFVEYRALVENAYPLEFHRARHYQTHEQWARFAGSGFRGSALQEYDPTLETLLQHRAFVILGEPGAGKSTAAHAAARLAFERDWVPVVLALRSYGGKLSDLFPPLPPEFDATDRERLLILDGFDEVPATHLAQFIDELVETEQGDPQTRFLLTSRQAFFVATDTPFSRKWPTFFIDDLSSDDVDAFILNRPGLESPDVVEIQSG
ncbi:MAG: hypothetical protein AMXMBFR57_32310 [Acidimicrobiia bacterium]